MPQLQGCIPLWGAFLQQVQRRQVTLTSSCIFCTPNINILTQWGFTVRTDVSEQKLNVSSFK